MTFEFVMSHLKSKHLLLSKKLHPWTSFFLSVSGWPGSCPHSAALELCSSAPLSVSLYLRATVISMILLQKDIPQGDSSQMQLSGQSAEAVPAEPCLPWRLSRGQGRTVGLRQMSGQIGLFCIT